MTSATIHTLIDEVLDAPMVQFVSIIWENPDFLRDLLVNKIFVKDVSVTTWEEEKGKGSCSRRIVGKHPIPGFSWLPWLPLHTNTDKRETIKFDREGKELTIKEFSKIDGIPWHDIDVNLIWKVRDMGQQVHVVTTIQIVFHTGFIQAFAEMAALAEIEKFFVIWKVDARQALAAHGHGNSSSAAMMEGPLASILLEVASTSSVSNNTTPSCPRAVSHVATYSDDDDEGMDTWRSVVVDGESEVGMPISSHTTMRTDSCEATAATSQCLDSQGGNKRSDSPASFVNSAFTGFTSFSDNEASSAATTIGTMMSDNFTSLSNLFRPSPLAVGGESEKIVVPTSSRPTILSRTDSCDAAVATTSSQSLDSDKEMPSAATATMTTMMSDNFTAFSNFMTIGPSLFSESSTKNGLELTPSTAESSAESSGSSNSKHLQLEGPDDVNHVSRCAEDSADNGASTSFSLSIPFMDADASLLSGMQGALHRISLSMWHAGDGLLAMDQLSSPPSSPSSTTTVLPPSSPSSSS